MFKKKSLTGSMFSAASVIIIAMVIGVTLWSISGADKNMAQAVDKLSSFYMEELVGKREAVLRDALDKDFERLERVISLLKTENIQDEKALQELLSEAQTLYGAKKIAIVDGNNTVYSAHSIISDASRYSFLQRDFTGPVIVTSNLYGAKKQVVLALPVENMLLQDREIVACFMEIDIDDVASSLIYEDEKGAANTFIGLYYKNGESLTSSRFDDVDPEENLLAYIRSTELLDVRSVEEIENRFRNGESGLITLGSDDDTEYIYYVPVEGTDWILTVMVHDNTIADQLRQTNSTVLRRNFFQLISTVALIIVISAGVGLLYKRNSDMRRKQQEYEERARNEEELRIARDAAEKANKAKTDFLFNMSHDIRTPMNAIIGFSKIMEKELEKPAQLKDHLNKLQESSTYLLSLINNVLDMARIESGNEELNIEMTDLLAPENKVSDMFGTDFQKKDLHYSGEINITHRYVYEDAQKNRQIIANLISNAVKYTPMGGDIRFRMEEIPCQEEGYASYELSVSDTGIGMSEEFQKHIFESFTREHTSTENNVIGTGLGMAIVKNLVDMQGGTISVESELGKGTKFTVHLTFRIAEAPEEYARKQISEEENSAKIAGKRILLAEDNDINAEIAMEILEDFGVRVERAEDGIVCVDMLKKAAQGYYDLILMDIQMPNMNGYQATETIRRLPDPEKAGIPIIAMTANAFEEDRKNALASGMNGHLAKPVDVSKLLETLGTFIGEE